MAELENKNFDLWDTDKDEVLVENNAQSIYDHINELEKDRQNNEKRWFWELLQNAKDSVGVDERVSIKIFLTPTHLTFTHNGRAFQRKDLLHLIFHGSSKKKSEGKTGRFGTGFMTTHLLSKKVRIQGELVEGGYFNFVLDRSAESHSQQKDSLDTSYENFKRSVTSASPAKDDFKTSFIYDLTTEDNSKQFNIAEEGLTMLHYILPVVLALNPKLESVQTNDGRTVTNKESSKILYDDAEIETHIVQNSDTDLKVIVLNDIDFNIAVICDKPNGVWELRKLTEEYPKLFFDFPLFGTENFGSSFIINSLKFDPRRERDGIHLGTSEKLKVLRNKEIIEKAFTVFPKLVGYLGNEQVGNLYNLYYLQKPSDYVWLDKVWIQGVLASLVSNLVALECLQHSQTSPAKISLLLSKIPYANGEPITTEMYMLISSLYPDNTVLSPLVSQWLEIVSSLAEITSTEIENLEYILTTEKICKIIDDSSDLSTFNNSFFNDINTSLQWLNDFYSLLNEEEMLKLSLTYKIVPNQADLFLKRNSDGPKFEKGNNKDLKDTSNLYGWQIENQLIHSQIKYIEGFDIIDDEQIIDALERLNQKVTGQDLNDKTMRAFVFHLKSLISRTQEEKLKDLFVFVPEKREAGLAYACRRLYLDENRKLMAPKLFWAESFPYYIELISDKFILPDLYSDIISPNEFQLLFDNKLLYAEPLYQKKKKASKTDLNNLLYNKDSLAMLCDDNGELKNYEIEFSDIPYFSKGEDGLLAKSGDSIKSSRNLLKFILFDVLPKDNMFNTYSNIDATRYLQCYWLARLKDTKWVAYRSLVDENISIKSEMASTVTIGAILESESDLTKALNSEKTAVFFNMLGISIADILRSFIPDDTKKLQWDLIFSKLLINKNINPEIAQEMLEDKNLQEIYLQKKKDRDTIKRNQHIGSTFESSFKSIFESPEMSQIGLGIKRKPNGSDFELLLESDVIENDQEILYEVGNVLIELKATAKNVAEMTVLQGYTAATSEQKFVLAVLPLEMYDINEINVKKFARFIVDIKEVVMPHYIALQTYSKEKQLAITDSTGAKLSIEEGIVRYQIKSELWKIPSVRSQPSLSFNEFIEWIKLSKDKTV